MSAFVFPSPESRGFFSVMLSSRSHLAMFSLGYSPDSKVHGANMGPIWGRQDPGGHHVGPMLAALTKLFLLSLTNMDTPCSMSGLTWNSSRKLYQECANTNTHLWKVTGYHMWRHGNSCNENVILSILLLKVRTYGSTIIQHIMGVCHMRTRHLNVWQVLKIFVLPYIQHVFILFHLLVASVGNSVNANSDISWFY